MAPAATALGTRFRNSTTRRPARKSPASRPPLEEGEDEKLDAQAQRARPPFTASGADSRRIARKGGSDARGGRGPPPQEEQAESDGGKRGDRVRPGHAGEARAAEERASHEQQSGRPAGRGSPPIPAPGRRGPAGRRRGTRSIPPARRRGRAERGRGRGGERRGRGPSPPALIDELGPHQSPERERAGHERARGRPLQAQVRRLRQRPPRSRKPPEMPEGGGPEPAGEDERGEEADQACERARCPA